MTRLYFWVEYPSDHIIFLNDDGKSYDVIGQVCLEPDYRRDDVRYVVCVESVNGVEASGRILLKRGWYPGFEYGDVIGFRGQFETPFEEDGFSYKNYLKIFRVSSVFKSESGVWIVEKDEKFFTYVFRFKNWMLGEVEASVSEPASSLVGGLLLGVRKGFSDEIMGQFNDIGLTHIIAVSGYNVSLIILIMGQIFVFVPRQIRFFIIGGFLFIFAVLTGLSASVLRAVIMGVISLAALQVGSKYNFGRGLLFTALAMFFWNPAFLFYDAGFHLSFLSTMGVVYLAKYFDFKFMPDFMGLREAFVLTIAASVATAPVLILSFGRISLISPFANMFVAPFIPVLMLLGFLLVVFSWSGWISFILVTLISSLSWYLFLIVDLFSF